MFNTLLRRLRGRDRHQPDPNCPHPYGRELTAAEVARKKHRAFVGGKWDEIGQLQFEFLKGRGLRSEHHLLDIGCGALRGGIHFIRYLDPGHYHGIDMNASLIRAGQTIELVEARLQDRRPHLLVNGAFEFNRFETKVDFALAVSVFTHLPINSIQRCLINLAEVLKPGGRFYATYFEAPTLHYLQPLPHPGDIVTASDADPFHYHFSVFRFLVNDLPLTVTNLGDWSHPRGQCMLEFVNSH